MSFTTPVCPSCGTVLLPGNRVCPFCRMPITPAPRPAAAPAPATAPSPPQYCPNCTGPLPRPQSITFPRVADGPITLDAYICPRCGRVELYRPAG